MFHTWEASPFPSHELNEAEPSSSGKRRITSTARACEPCRKRKIRCNGGQPCDSCSWYRKAASCQYTEPRQRQLPSRKSVEKISETNQDYRAILHKMFPDVDPDRLKDLTREDLLDLLTKMDPSAGISPLSAITPGSDEKPTYISPHAANLEQLQLLPESDNEEPGSDYSALQGITDNVNALSLCVSKPTSYLGISSVTAVLRVILWLDPEAQTFFAEPPDKHPFPASEAQSLKEKSGFVTSTTSAKETSFPSWDEIPLLDAYFNYIHPFAPLLDESDFRDTYMSRRRSDSRWELLLNTVLALGSIAKSSQFDEPGHTVYWLRAKRHLTIDTLEVTHIETVQAMALLSGLYLHYIQQPNLANSLMGATLRLAVALGLHRDYSEGLSPAKRDKTCRSIELRRCVWWSIFVLDAYIGYGLGRPSMGRMCHAITAKHPQHNFDSSSQLLTVFQDSIRFCIITTRMEDMLANSPFILESERHILDSSLVDWFQSSSVQEENQTAQSARTHGILISKNVMRWRYLLCRVLIHRPVMLWAAMRRIPMSQLRNEKKKAVNLCRDMTDELVNDIVKTWQTSKPCTMSGWNATWLLYQALMVPLLNLYADVSDQVWNEKNMNLVELGLKAFGELEFLSPTANRSAQVISLIYQASRRHTDTALSEQTTLKHDDSQPIQDTHSNTAEHRHSFGTLDFTMTHSPTQQAYMNNMFDYLNWNNNWVNESLPPGQAVVNSDNIQGDFVGLVHSYDQIIPVSHRYDTDSELLGTRDQLSSETWREESQTHFGLNYAHHYQ